jgi:hypothetical protein
MGRRKAANTRERIELVCLVVLEVRRGGLEERQDVAERLDLGIELGCCAAVRSLRLWLSLYRGDF